MHEYTVELDGLTREAAGLPATVAYPLIGAIYHGAKGSVRLEIDGRSAAPGVEPSWLGQVADFRVEVADEFSGLKVRAPTLGRVCPDKFATGMLFGEPIAELSAFSFLFRALSDALEGRTDSEACDQALLRMFAEFSQVLAAGVSVITIKDGRGRSPAMQIDPPGLTRASSLRDRTPAARQVHVAGTLDPNPYSEDAFTLLLQDAERTRIRGYLSEALQRDVLRSYRGKEVALSALVHFRPDGAPFRIEAQHVRLATDNDLSVFSEVPQPLESQLEVTSLTRPQGPSTGINAIWGRWPGDESADEIINALERAERRS
jgi:hypothetical protein